MEMTGTFGLVTDPPHCYWYRMQQRSLRGLLSLKVGLKFNCIFRIFRQHRCSVNHMCAVFFEKKQQEPTGRIFNFFCFMIEPHENKLNSSEYQEVRHLYRKRACFHTAFKIWFVSNHVRANLAGRFTEKTGLSLLFSLCFHTLRSDMLTSCWRQLHVYCTDMKAVLIFPSKAWQ